MTLVSVTAYHSFGGEVEASNTPTIRRLTPSCRHQLPRIAPLVTACHTSQLCILFPEDCWSRFIRSSSSNKPNFWSIPNVHSKLLTKVQRSIPLTDAPHFNASMTYRTVSSIQYGRRLSSLSENPNSVIKTSFFGYKLC